MVGYQIAERVEPALADVGETGEGRGEGASGPGGRVDEQRPAERVVLQQSVPAGAGDRAHAGTVRGERFTAVHGRPAVADLVAGDREPLAGRAGTLAEYLVRGEGGSHREQAEAVHLPGTGLDRVVDATAEHLVSAADPEHRPASGRAGPQCRVQASAAQPGEVRHGRASPRDDHKIGVDQVRGPGGEGYGHAGLGPQRVDVGDVGQSRQPDHRYPQEFLDR